MAEDVRVYGELIEFLRQFKCEACQTRDRKCLIQKNDGRCMLCTDADRQCVFTRTVRIKGPRSAFEWESLLGQETVVPIEITGRPDGMSRSFNAVNGSSKSNGHGVNHHDLRDNSFPQPYSPDSRRVSAGSPRYTRELLQYEGKQVNPGSFTAVNPSQAPPFQTRILPVAHRPLKPAPSPSAPSGFDHGPAVKRSRSLEPEGKEHAAKIRRIGACDDCRQRKLKCHHVDGLSGPDEQRDSVVEDPHRNEDPPPSQPELPRPSGTESNVKRQNPKPYVCMEPDCPRIAGFSTRNDLDRHKRSVHRISSDSRYTTAYKCAGSNCAKPDKIWPRLDNFRSHCERMHNKEDINALLRRSEIDPITEEPIYRAPSAMQLSIEASQAESLELMSAYEASLHDSRVTSPTSSAAIPMSTSDSSVTCSICGLELKGKAIWLSGNLMRHIREKHTSISRLRKCDLCGKQFSRNHNLYMHLSQVHQISRADADAHISRDSMNTIEYGISLKSGNNTFLTSDSFKPSPPNERPEDAPRVDPRPVSSEAETKPSEPTPAANGDEATANEVPPTAEEKEVNPATVAAEFAPPPPAAAISTPEESETKEGYSDESGSK